MDGDTARVTIKHGELKQAVDVTVDPDGRPVEVSFQRWSNANAEKVHRLQPFGAIMWAGKVKFAFRFRQPGA